MKMWLSRSLFPILLVLPLLVNADLPSCYRARCTHCRIQFIAQMCPQTCTNCPEQAFSGKALQPFQAVNNAGTTINVVTHGKPTVYRTAEHVQTLSQTDAQPQNAFVQQPAQPSYQAPTPQQQQIGAQPASTPQQGFQVPHAQQYVPQPANNYGQQYGPQLFNNQYSQFGQVQQFGGQQQVQQPFFPTASPPQTPQFPGFQQPGQPQQFAGFGQPAPTPATGMFNPFQPFLQQSFQAQGGQPQPPQQPQTPYNPFTFPTLPPSATFAPFTATPVTLPPHTFPTFPPFPTHAPLAQGPQLPVSATQAPPAANTYQGQQLVGGQAQSANNYIQSGQTPAVESQRPRQVYNTQQQSGQSQFNGQPQGQAGYLQPARSNAIPTVQVQQPARSIDQAPVQLEKQAYIGKGAPPAFIDQCPKQPGWEPCIAKDLANERFRNCCQRLGEGCSQLCNYDQSLTTLQLAVLTGRCPIAKVADMMICASGYEDATPCCQAYGVFEPGFEHCRPYCNPAAGLPNDGMLSEKYKCLGKLSQIQRCFYVSQRP